MQYPNLAVNMLTNLPGLKWFSLCITCIPTLTVLCNLWFSPFDDRGLVTSCTLFIALTDEVFWQVFLCTCVFNPIDSCFPYHFGLLFVTKVSSTIRLKVLRLYFGQNLFFQKILVSVAGKCAPFVRIRICVKMLLLFPWIGRRIIAVISA